MSNGGSKRDRWRDETFEPKRLGQEGGAGKRVIGKSRGGGRRSAIFRLIGRKKETLYRSRRRRRWPRNRTTGSVHRSGKLEGGPGALTPARCRCWSGSAFLPGPICRGWSSRDVPPAVSSIHVTADKISPAPPKAMKITLEFVGWLDERLYSRAVCGLLEKRAICPPLEAERNFERRERGGEERERERESVHRTSWRGVPRVLYVLRVSNVQFLGDGTFFFFLLTVYLHIGSQPKSKISNRSFHPIGLDRLAKLKYRRR